MNTKTTKHKTLVVPAYTIVVINITHIGYIVVVVFGVFPMFVVAGSK